jgi:hypothetical protein
MSNTDGLNTFPAIPYSMAGEYGPALIDIRHGVSLGGTINAKWDFALSPLFTFYSGQPFEITVGHNLYGGTLFNGRPGRIATNSAKTAVIQTTYGLLDPNPNSDEQILPRNCGRGPGIILLNFRMAKTFAFGNNEFFRRVPTGPFSTGGGGRTKQRRISQRPLHPLIVNLGQKHPKPQQSRTDHRQYCLAEFWSRESTYGVGILGGTGFSESANNRRLDMQARFTF